MKTLGYELINLHLGITSKCNLNCEGCWYARKDRRDMPFKEIQRIACEAKELGVRNVAIGGGEPLLHPEISEIVRYLKDLGFHVSITSNGTMLKELEVDELHLSADELHGFSSERLFCLKRAIEFYRKRGISIGINHVFESVANLEWWMERFPEVDSWLVILKKPIILSDDFLKECCRLWEFFWRKKEKHFMVDSCFYRLFHGRQCMMGRWSLYIGVDGKASRWCGKTTGVFFLRILKI